MLTFGGMQWRIAGWLSGIPFTTLHTSFARWTRLGMWRRLGQRLALDWRLACGDEVLPSAVVVDSRSLRSSPSAWVRGFDGGKLVKGLKLFVVCDKHGSLLDLELHPANTDDRAGILPALPRLAALGFQGDLLGDSGFKGAPFAEAALEHDIHVSVSPGGTRDGRFLPNGIRWVVERLFAWLSRYRRLNIVYDRAPDLFAGHVWIAMISIISRRIVAQTQVLKRIYSRTDSYLHGKDKNDRQRFRCRTTECRRTFNILTGTPMARAQKPKKWGRYLSYNSTPERPQDHGTEVVVSVAPLEWGLGLRS
jgi:transposase